MQTNRFPYLQDLPNKYLIEPMPYLPLTLEREGNGQKVFGLLIQVLP